MLIYAGNGSKTCARQAVFRPGACLDKVDDGEKLPRLSAGFVGSAEKTNPILRPGWRYKAMTLGHGESRESKSARQDLGQVLHEPARQGGVDLGHGESGQTTVVMTLFMATFLTGFIGLGIDANNLFAAKRQAQAAADAAAIAAAEESPNGTDAQNSAAAAIAKLNGFDNGAATNPASVNVTTPSGGNYGGASGYVQVVVSKPVPTIFAGYVTGSSTITVSGRSVAARDQTSPSCICLEGTTGTDLNMSNGTSLASTGCGVMVDSSSSNAVTMGGSSTINSQSLGIVSSTWTAAANVTNGASISNSTRVITGITTSCAPPVPTAPTFNSAQCTPDPLTHYQNGNSSYSLGPGSTYSTTQTGGVVCYNSLIVGSNSDTVNLNSGIYVINGGTLEFQNGHSHSSNTGGNSVLFYLTNGANLIIDQGANVNLTAPSTGTYAGILVLQDPNDTAAMSIAGGSNTSFNGSIIAPTVNVNLSNGSGTTLSADMVAKTLTMTGSGDLTSTDTIINGSPTTNFGTLNTSTAKMTE
jgi:hypothetical protein